LSGRKFTFPANPQKLESVTLESGSGLATLLLRVNGADYRVPCGHGNWTKAKLAFANLHEQPVAASGAWLDDNTLGAKVCFYETPFTVTLRLHFADDQLQIDPEFNVGFGATKGPQLAGTPVAQ
jgi:hypothetical protein